MKTLLLLFLALVPAFAGADPPPNWVENMVARCEIVMAPGVCAVSNGKTIIFGRTSELPGGSYDASMYSALGYSKAPNGEYAMCKLIRDECTAGRDRLGCVIARYRFQQTPP